MTEDTRLMLDSLKRVLSTRRRYKVAMLALGRDLTQCQIAKRLRISQPTVHREMQVIAQVRQDVREQQQAIANGTACPFPSPSLN